MCRGEDDKGKKKKTLSCLYIYHAIVIIKKIKWIREPNRQQWEDFRIIRGGGGCKIEEIKNNNI